MKALILLLLVGSALAQDNTFTNRTVTFTNLQNRVYTNVTLFKANLDGVLWRDSEGLGSVSYTNLAPALLEEWGIPTNRIAEARQRAQRRAAFDALDRINAATRAQQDLARLSDQQAEAARTQAKNAQQEELQRIKQLEAQCNAERLYLTKLQRNVDMNNALNDGSKTFWVDPNRYNRLDDTEAELQKLKDEYVEKYRASK
jgi:hypothetical protein